MCQRLDGMQGTYALVANWQSLMGQECNGLHWGATRTLLRLPPCLPPPDRLPPHPQVLQEDGSVLPCALNAACAALVDAGVPLSTMFGGSGGVG